MSVSLKAIEVEGESCPLAGVPWKEAPCGPVRVVDAPRNALVVADDVFVSVKGRDDGGMECRRALLPSGWPWMFDLNSSVRVEPLDACKVTFVFERD
jgi:hypothetical protein